MDSQDDYSSRMKRWAQQNGSSVLAGTRRNLDTKTEPDSSESNAMSLGRSIELVPVPGADPASPKSQKLVIETTLRTSDSDKAWKEIAKDFESRGVAPEAASRFIAAHEAGHAISQKAAMEACSAWSNGGPAGFDKWSKANPELASALHPELTGKDGLFRQEPSTKRQLLLKRFLEDKKCIAREEAFCDSYALMSVQEACGKDEAEKVRAAVSDARKNADPEHATAAAVQAAAPGKSKEEAAAKAANGEYAAMCGPQNFLANLSRRRAALCGTPEPEPQSAPAKPAP